MFTCYCFLNHFFRQACLFRPELEKEKRWSIENTKKYNRGIHGEWLESIFFFES